MYADTHRCINPHKFDVLGDSINSENCLRFHVLKRLGKVLYWIGWIVAAPLAVLGTALIVFGVNGDAAIFGGMLVFLALVIWSAGRAAKYILSAE
jgi:hypothetical protein